MSALRDSYRCVTPDYLGFGLSERPWGADYSPEAHSRCFRAWVEELDLRDVALMVHDFGGPIALPMTLERLGRVSRLIVLNSWIWSFTGNRKMERKARLAGSRLGRWMYRTLNVSLRMITPSAYADRKKLTPRIHAQYLAPFVGIDSRERVLHALARALLVSSDFYADLWERRGAPEGGAPPQLEWSSCRWATGPRRRRPTRWWLRCGASSRRARRDAVIRRNAARVARRPAPSRTGARAAGRTGRRERATPGGFPARAAPRGATPGSGRHLARWRGGARSPSWCGPPVARR